MRFVLPAVLVALVSGPIAQACEIIIMPGPLTLRGQSHDAALNIDTGDQWVGDAIYVFARPAGKPLSARTRFILGRRYTPHDSGPDRIVWASSEDCPAARVFVSALLAAPTQDAPERSDARPVTVLRTDANGDVFVVRGYTDDGGAIDRLRGIADRTLRDCWRRDLASVGS